MSKKSIRFYKDHEVRSIWDEEQSQWWFSIVDVVAAVTESPNPRKYWSVLKTRLKKAGNELTTRIWLDLILKKQLGLCIDWSKIGKRDYLDAMIESEMDSSRIRELLRNALTDLIDDREIFMKGIDYSYYYEQEDDA